MAIYEHWVGTATGRASPAAPRSQTFDHWIPAQAPANAMSIGKNQVSGEIVHKLYEIIVKAGPFHISEGIDFDFDGTIEYFQTP